VSLKKKKKGDALWERTMGKNKSIETKPLCMETKERCLRGNQLSRLLDLRLLSFRVMRNILFLFRLQSVVLLYGSPSKPHIFQKCGTQSWKQSHRHCLTKCHDCHFYCANTMIVIFIVQTPYLCWCNVRFYSLYTVEIVCDCFSAESSIQRYTF
jgi:hypothetical protein